MIDIRKDKILITEMAIPITILKIRKMIKSKK